MKWRATGQGRPVGSLGPMARWFSIVVEGEDAKEAIDAVYAKWEHISGLRLVSLSPKEEEQHGEKSGETPETKSSR